MSTITLSDAQAHLSDIVHRLTPGEEVVITDGDKPVATLVGPRQPPSAPRQPGSAKGLLVVVADDDDHLKDFAEYM
jgi:antitoxin (DNA-binding transcriptional repressor) of toxin-antitoxin stability system